MGLSLLTVALEAGAHHLGNFTSLMNLVKDDMCKNLFMVIMIMVIMIMVIMIMIS